MTNMSHTVRYTLRLKQRTPSCPPTGRNLAIGALEHVRDLLRFVDQANDAEIGQQMFND